MTEASEFNKIYNLDVVAIPTNKPTVRKDSPDIIYKTERQKYYSVVEEITEMHEEGRPVLVGTTSIEKSELIDELLASPQSGRVSPCQDRQGCRVDGRLSCRLVYRSAQENF